MVTKMLGFGLELFNPFFSFSNSNFRYAIVKIIETDSS